MIERTTNFSPARHASLTPCGQVFIAGGQRHQSENIGLVSHSDALDP